MLTDDQMGAITRAVDESASVNAEAIADKIMDAIPDSIWEKIWAAMDQEKEVGRIMGLLQAAKICNNIYHDIAYNDDKGDELRAQGVARCVEAIRAAKGE